MGKSTAGQHICLVFEGDTQREGAPWAKAENSDLSTIRGEGEGEGPRGRGGGFRKAPGHLEELTGYGGLGQFGCGVTPGLLLWQEAIVLALEPGERFVISEVLPEGLCWADWGSSEKASLCIIVFQEPSAHMCQSGTFGVACPTIMGGHILLPFGS